CVRAVAFQKTPLVKNKSPSHSRHMFSCSPIFLIPPCSHNIISSNGYMFISVETSPTPTRKDSPHTVRVSPGAPNSIFPNELSTLAKRWGRHISSYSSPIGTAVIMLKHLHHCWSYVSEF